MNSMLLANTSDYTGGLSEEEYKKLLEELKLGYYSNSFSSILFPAKVSKINGILFFKIFAYDILIKENINIDLKYIINGNSKTLFNKNISKEVIIERIKTNGSYEEYLGEFETNNNQSLYYKIDGINMSYDYDILNLIKKNFFRMEFIPNYIA